MAPPCILCYLGRRHSLLGVEVCGGFVEQVDVGVPAEAARDGHALQLAAGQVRHLQVQDILNLE